MKSLKNAFDNILFEAYGVIYGERAYKSAPRLNLIFDRTWLMTHTCMPIRLDIESGLPDMFGVEDVS